MERVQGLDAPARYAFEMAVDAEEAVAAQDLEVLIEKVWFEDGTVWRRGASETLDFRPSPLLQGMRLQVMQELAGRDAASYPSDQGKVWVCVCGRANAAREETGLNRVCLSGGSFQNMYIMHRLPARLRAAGFAVYHHSRVSTNDEGIALGQLMIANAKVERERKCVLPSP